MAFPERLQIQPIEPLPQRKQPSKGETLCLLENPITCRIDSRARFISNLETFNALLVDSGENAGKISKISDLRINQFDNAINPNEQKKQNALLLEELDGSLKNRLNKDLIELHDVLSENGYDKSENAFHEDEWKNKFNKASRQERLQITRDIREETGRKMVDHFDYYLTAWGVTLMDMGRPSEEAQAEVNELNNKFLNASERGKVGIAKTLREKIRTATEMKSVIEIDARFTAFWEIYEKEITEKGLAGEDYPDAQKILELYISADSGKKTSLLNNIETLARRALSQKPKGFPNA